MNDRLDFQAVSIALIGKLNPAIITPAWMSKNQLISNDAFESASISVIHEQISQFTVPPFFFEVTPKRFFVRSQEEPSVRMLDLILLLFSDNLPHTPLSQLGVNLEARFDTQSPANRIEFGRHLAPLGPWGRFGKRIEESPMEQAGGVYSLVMQETKPANRDYGYRRVEVGPVPQSFTAVQAKTNDHYELQNIRDEDGAEGIIKILSNQFEPSLNESKDIISDLIEFADRIA